MHLLRTMPIVVNHVMSQDIASGIFADILRYFRTLSPSDVKYEVSIEPIAQADIYHYHRPQLEKKLRAPSVCTVHHDLGETDTWLSLAKFLPRYRESSMIVCLNTLQRDRLIDEGIHPARLTVIPHGYNDQILSLKPRRTFEPNRKLVIGFVSKRYGRRVKGEAYLYEMAKRLSPERFAFLLVGAERMTDAVALRSLGFEVRCYERLPYRAFNGLYASMDFLMMASQFEGGPANIPEALATGTPVLTNPIGMAFDLVRHGINGMHLSMDPNTDISVFELLAANANGLTDSLYAGAHAEAATATTWAQCVERNVKVYRGIALKAAA